jgi:condensin complex subunit 1
MKVSIQHLTLFFSCAVSRLLFHELSKRSNNPVYNLLPEITSQLSQLSIKKEDFRYIMSFLLSYVKKERQNEMLTEKFCQRFPKCNSISQTADLAYSIAQLKMTEKSIKCLSDNFNLYKDSLFDEDVHKSFLSIVTKAKKAMKPEKRQFLEEWEAKMNDFAQLGAENQQADEKAARAKSRASRRAARKKQQKKKIVEQEEDDDDGKPDEFEFAGDDEVDDVTVEKENAPASKAKSRTSSRRSQRVAFSN